MTHVISFVGSSGVGKTTLIEQLITLFRLKGLRVSTVKHSHHLCETDRPGKDTWRMKKAGSFETVLISETEMVLQRSFENPYAMSIHEVLSQMFDGVDWIFVEGFKHSDLLKFEVISDQNAPDKPLFQVDDFVTAIACDQHDLLSFETSLPIFSLERPDLIADWITHNQDRFFYSMPLV